MEEFKILSERSLKDIEEKIENYFKMILKVDIKKITTSNKEIILLLTTERSKKDINLKIAWPSAASTTQPLFLNFADLLFFLNTACLKVLLE